MLPSLLVVLSILKSIVMNAVLSIRKMSFFVLLTIFLISCSKEDLNEEILPNETLTKNLELSTSTVTPASTCTKIYPFYKVEWLEINSTTYKILRSYTYQSDTHLRVQAEYEISLSKDDLPATITIDINGNQQIFKKVHPGTIVTHSVELPIGWQEGDAITYMVEQKGFLKPVKIEHSYILQIPCPVE